MEWFVLDMTIRILSFWPVGNLLRDFVALRFDKNDGAGDAQLASANCSCS